MKELIIAALERDLNAPAAQQVETSRPPLLCSSLLCLPLVRLSKGKKLDLDCIDFDGIDFDDLLA